MRRISLFALFALTVFALVACTHPQVNKYEISETSDNSVAGNHDTDEKQVDEDNGKNMIAMFDRIEFTSIHETDRADRNADVELNRPLTGQNEPTGCAVCLVTVLNIDLDDCIYEMGKKPPIEIRIDNIYGSNPAFGLTEGDTIVTADYGSWFKTDNGYRVQYDDGSIPMTEQGAQYVVSIYSANEAEKSILWESLDYRTEALTIPIIEDGDISAEEIYEKMDLPDDVRRCSEELIKRLL